MRVHVCLIVMDCSLEYLYCQFSFTVEMNFQVYLHVVLELN